MEEQAPQWSLGTIAGTLGTIAIVAIAALGVYIDGVVLTYVGFIQPGVVTVFAAGYLALVILVPLTIGRTMRAKGTAWRRTIAAVAAGAVGVSLLFLPFTTAAFAM